ncbi:hypothetical protein L1049_009400 [Liquidambar formosana]|uniref:Aminotransferase-like plant mobile domain-containing protein n=1 Tax=Liquidambar formosana TaxID=63359 RepID=A0AAP0SAY2_LIQFO
MEHTQPFARDFIKKAGFSWFLDSLWNEQWDRQALLALAELWWDTTNTFHFSFGEMTMTPKDFSIITGLSLKGKRLEFYGDANTDSAYLLTMLGMDIEAGSHAVLGGHGYSRILPTKYGTMNTWDCAALPCLDNEIQEWPILGNYAPNKIAVRAPNRHDYAHARAYLASLNADMVEWSPWGLWEGRLPRRCVSYLELTGKKVLFEGPSWRYWYLGERVLRQVKGRVDTALTPVLPPMNMRHTDSLDGDELMEALTGWDAEEFTSPNTDYMTFCNQFLMRPRVIGFPPQGSRQARRHSSTIASSTGMTHGDEDYEMGGMAQPPLPVLDWQVNLCNGLEFMRTDITRPAFDEVPKIDSSYEHVPREYAQECLELSEGLRRDLVRMSLANSVLEERLNPTVSTLRPPQLMPPQRNPHAGHGGGESSRKRRTTGDH